MKLPQIKNHKWNYLALSFVFPFICTLGIMLFGGYEPFGDSRSMLYSDMYHQYYPFFVSFREALRSGDSLLYTWNIGMGLDHLGLISYYLASPLNLLTVFLPESWLLEYFSLLMPIKLGLASLFFAIFLKKMFQKDDLSITLFGSLYGLCAWALGYQWNIMWLDTFALLPLVVLGMISLLRDRKFFLYTFTLFLSVCSNYYIGLFTCIFVFLLFFCYEICRFRGFKRFFTDLCFIALFSILALGMTAFLELPAYTALQTTQSSVNNFPKTFRLNIADENTWKGLLDAMRQVAGNMGGGLTPSFKEGLPNLYCGVISIVLAFLYLTCKQVRIRDRVVSLLMLLFFMVSFIIRQLDYIWHGFHFTNMIPYRFSFLFSFVLLYMAYKAYLLRSHFKLWQIILAGIASLGVLACSNDRFDPVFLAYNAIFLIVYLGILLFPLLLKAPPRGSKKEVRIAYKEGKEQRHHVATLILACVLAVELIINVINFGVAFPYTSVSNYPKGTADTADVINYMKEKEKDNPFYRAEVTHAQTLNDGALNGYNGISTFTSSANVKVTKFIQALGFGAKNTYNRYCYEESSPVANLFLGLKYMIERDGNVESNAYFDPVYQKGKVTLLENNAYLPLGFLADVQLTNVVINTNTDAFTLQNNLIAAASGLSKQVLHQLGRQTLQVTSTDVTVTSTSASGHSAYETGESSGTVTYSFTSDRSGLMCINLNLPKKNSYTVSHNGVKLYSETYSLPQCLSVCEVVPGDVVEIKLTCKAKESGGMTIQAAVVDEEQFRKCYNALSASTLNLTKFTNTYVEGTIDCNRDGLLYTSIPQNGNWTVKVDCKETDIELIADVMISVTLTQGEHTVTFHYKNAAFSLGWKISLACFILLIGLTVPTHISKFKRGKYAKQ